MINPVRAPRIDSVHFSSQTDEWATPSELFDNLDEEFSFTLDPCATHENAKCEKYYTKQTSGLAMAWENHTVFMNPPYGREIGRWLRKAYNEKDATVVCLIPARTDTTWWHKYCMYADQIRLFIGRLKFGDSENSAPFPSALVIFNPTNTRERRIPFFHSCNEHGALLD